jgi:hypothetical protein
MTEKRPGLMIAMFDVPEHLEDEFNRWYNEEHIPEKVGTVPGFIRARRYESLDGRPNHVCIYELEDISVVENPAYQANYKSGTTTTEYMKAKAKTFYRNVYIQTADFHGISLDDAEKSED